MWLVLLITPNVDIPNAVLDTNVIIALHRSKQGSAYKLLISLVDNLFVPNISVPLLLEYKSVAKRKGMVPEEMTKDDIETILDYLLRESSIRKVI
jgi:predicted nucleic acid-binding protein